LARQARLAPLLDRLQGYRRSRCGAGNGAASHRLTGLPNNLNLECGEALQRFEIVDSCIAEIEPFELGEAL